MFAPNFHGAMKHAAPVRRELGVRTFSTCWTAEPTPRAPTISSRRIPSRSVGIQARVLQARQPPCAGGYGADAWMRYPSAATATSRNEGCEINEYMSGRDNSG